MSPTPDHIIIITATDTADNTNTQTVTISVQGAPEVIITGTTSGYVNGDITLTFTFSEPIVADQFEDLDIEVLTGGTDAKGTFMEVTPDERYTVVATPLANTNDGVLTVTVRFNAVTGMSTGFGSQVTSMTQQYDTVDPILAGGAGTTAIRYIDNDLPRVPFVYDADATDDGGDADGGITYSFGGGDEDALFTIDPGTGIVSYITIPTSTELTHNITVVATDKGGNTDTLPVRIAVISRATVDSVSATDGFYNAGDILSITVEFSEAVTVTTSPSGTASLSLRDVGTEAVYDSGSGTTSLIFTYTVRPTDSTRNLRYRNTTSLVLETGGSIRTRSDTLDADLTLPMPGSANSLSGSSNVVLDNTAPVFPDAASSSDPLVLTIATGSTAATVVYDAAATDSGRPADTGITYELTADGSGFFALDTPSGVLTPAADRPAMGTYSVTITATDEAENVSATQHLRVVVADVPTATITPIGSGTANIASGALTFTLSFSESVTGFESGDLTFTGGDLLSIAQTPVAGDTYTSADLFTILATPDPNTNVGTLTVMLLAGAAHASSDTSRLTPVATASRAYDTLAPPAPTFAAATIAEIEVITRAEEVVTLTGTVESGASVRFCFYNNSYDGTSLVDDCPDGTTSRFTNTADTTTWSLTLDSAAITLIGEGVKILRAVATDAAGNTDDPGAVASTPMLIDTVPPDAPTFDTISGDDFINAAEQNAGVTITGAVGESGTTIQFCYGGDGSNTCGGDSPTASMITNAGTTWSYLLTAADYTAAGEGAANVQARATDANGNPGLFGVSKPFTLDTMAPVFTNGATGTGSVAVGSAITVTAYDAARHQQRRRLGNRGRPA